MSEDRLYDLLPYVARMNDAARGAPLRALLRVIGEQVDVVEADIQRLYENWFIETCDEWVVPYIAELIGWRPAGGVGAPGLPARILAPRREIANTIRSRRRRGTLPPLEELARDVAGWPARAVEFYRLLAWIQHANHLRPGRGRTVNVRRGDALDRLDGPFDELAHTVDVRRIASRRRAGRFNLPSVGVFVWRLGAQSVTRAPAYMMEAFGPHLLTFSVLGADAQLVVRPPAEEAASAIAGPLDVPAPIRRRALERHVGSFYGADRSLAIWTGSGPAAEPPELSLVPAERIVSADLTDWQYRPRAGTVAIDPELGRIAFPPGEAPRRGVWVTYHTAGAADIGGGEYPRPLATAPEAVVYPVGDGEAFGRIGDALAAWRQEAPASAVIEVTGSGVYVEQLRIELAEGQRLELRAAERSRPVLRLLDWQTSLPDAISVTGEAGGCFVLDGFLVTGRGLLVEGGIEGVVVRHSTLVPGWLIGPDCAPIRPTEPSIELERTSACLVVEYSIVGSIQVNQDEVVADPLRIRIADSVVDATSRGREAIGAPSWPLAHVLLDVRRSTVIGRVMVHAIELAENSIFTDEIRVARSQVGCIRFSYAARPCRTPRRFACQPDGAEEAVRERVRRGELDPGALDAALARARSRVRPRFLSLRYGAPYYARLTDDTAEEIRRGADDGSEMGVFHHLYEPQRMEALRIRLDEYTPVGMEAAVILAS